VLVLCKLGRTHRLRKRRLQLGVVPEGFCSGTAAGMCTQCVAGNFQITLLMIVGREQVSLARLRQSPSVVARMKDEAEAASTTRRVVVCLDDGGLEVKHSSCTSS
jgi:hypothetical protein